MSDTKFHRNLKRHISLSENLRAEVKKTGQDALNQMDKIDVNTSNQVLLKVINRMVTDILNIIQDLQEIVIKSSSEEKSNADLKEVLKKLRQCCNEMVQSYDNGSSIIKQKFLVFVNNIILATEDLLNIIKKDDLHYYKHELVENLKEILYTIDTSRIQIKIQNYSQQEIKNAIEAVKKDYFDDILKIKMCGDEILKMVAIHIKHTCKHNFKMAYYLNKVASNYDTEFQHKILESAKLMNIANSTFLFESEKSSNADESIVTLRNASMNCWNSLLGLLDFINNRLENKEHSENLKDIAIYLASCGLVVNKQLGIIIKHDSLFV